VARGIKRTEVPLEALGNIGYVRRLWDAFSRAALPRWPNSSRLTWEWRPLAADGRCRQGTEELAAFWASCAFEMPTIRTFQPSAMMCLSRRNIAAMMEAERPSGCCTASRARG
jgi:hypothetical protein